MNSVWLDGAGKMNEVLVNHGNEGDARARGRLAKDLVKSMNVIGAVIRGKGNAAQQNADVHMQQSRKHFVEILFGGRERQSAQAVVAAKFDDDHGRMQAQDRRKTLHGVFGGGAAGAKVDDLIAIAELVQVAPQRVRVRLAGCESVTGCDAVSKANENRLGLGKRAGGEQDSQEGNKNCATNVHSNSVCARPRGRNKGRAEEDGE